MDQNWSPKNRCINEIRINHTTMLYHAVKNENEIMMMIGFFLSSKFGNENEMRRKPKFVAT